MNPKMLKEIKESFRWLEFRHNGLKQMVERDKKMFESETMKNMTKGMELAIDMYDDRIEEIRKLLDGYLVNDVDLSGGEAI